MGDHSIYFYLLVAVMLAGVLHCVSVGFLFFFKRSGVKRANYFFGILLIAIGLTLLHNIFIISGIYESYPRLKFLPIYFTLTLPVALFYYVKLTLYPAYRLRTSDIKHFLLPVFQFLFFAGMFLMSVEFKSKIDRHFYNPFYGAFEQFLYLVGFFAYMYFAYRYIMQRQKTLVKKQSAKQILYLKKLIQILFVLFLIHTAFIVGDFAGYELLNISLRTVKPYAALGALSFAALAYWLGTYGFQVLLWGRRTFGRGKK
ncbi:MAG: hypothetical protein DWQ02_17365 [Bacteroidetes bacterium]|nr:MAG: hypothetical protein DWQ02_17365 [Bacteroidota bacterium]